jgi:hypothetical protein
MRIRPLLVAGAALLGLAALAAGLAARRVEKELTLAVSRVGAAHGVAVGEVGFSAFGPLRLRDVRSTDAGPGRLTVEGIDVDWTLRGGREPRAHVRRVRLRAARMEHGPLVVEWPEADLDVQAWQRDGAAERVHLRQHGAQGAVELTGPGEGVNAPAVATLSGFDLSKARVTWGGEPVLDPGRWTGRVTLSRAPRRLESEGALSGEGVRLALPRTLGLGDGGYGVPTALVVDWSVLRDGDSIEIRRATARLGGLDVDGHGRLARSASDRHVDLEVSGRGDIGLAFRTTGLAVPASLARVPANRLGTASFDVSLSGPLDDPRALHVVPRLSFESAPDAVEALQFLRRPFLYSPQDQPGVSVDVREGSPDFIPFGAVPPLFVRALLLSEDAGFWGHPGVDVAEIPVAWADNAERGGAARGASTITQQLAKNLFLSHDKTYGRKLTEAALALVLDAAVPKSRQLEIYLNVIEWGPGIHGLVPAARHYFGRTPQELTPKEIAFLVCLIPSPVRYHQAHAAGRLGPGMEQLTANLLAKLRSVDAIGDEEYGHALNEVVAFRPEGAP